MQNKFSDIILHETMSVLEVVEQINAKLIKRKGFKLTLREGSHGDRMAFLIETLSQEDVLG